MFKFTRLLLLSTTLLSSSFDHLSSSSGLSVSSPLLASAVQISAAQIHARQAEAAKRWAKKSRSVNPQEAFIEKIRANQRRDGEDVDTTNSTSTPASSTTVTPSLKPKNITFADPKASQFWVNGTTIPDVDFDVGDSWSGLIPISSDPKETRKLFFWFFPPGPEGSLDDLIFWTNGGPGCSSLEGFLQENGPFSWAPGTAKPTPNQYSWTNLSSVLWVEQPVGTGFSQGTPNINNEDDLAKQVVGFLQQFLEVFAELKGKKFYISGESYAGMYVPYIANYIYSNATTLDLSLQGTWTADPSLSWDVIQQQVPAVPFVNKYRNVFAFNQTFMSLLEKTADACNYTSYTSKYLQYPPPPAPFPLPGRSTSSDRGCDVWDLIFEEALVKNPAFNIYRIFDTFPVLWDVLGFPGSFPDVQSPIYFDRQEVKKAIHAPLNTTWEECADGNVFVRRDQSTPSALSVLPNVIEKNQRTVIVHGLADFILIAEGTRLVIQKRLFKIGGGAQGFQTAIGNDTFIVDGIGSMGTEHTERGLTYYEIELSGHMVPQFSPVAAFQTMEYLLGFRSKP
ncbi:alpha/beta-hydrolase [Pluteus cervinus]|uniref:Alpha/beta-hydrolase n=1 Tax=Pluteus cervinus TaxID=181527 RepID=A0ACD3ANK3_9AGAR|nr:alpha/beta-hydrolase [Pluteus cervinus]